MFSKSKYPVIATHIIGIGSYSSSQWHSLKPLPYSVKEAHEFVEHGKHLNHFSSILGRRFTSPPFIHRLLRFSNIRPVGSYLLMIA